MIVIRFYATCREVLPRTDRLLSSGREELVRVPASFLFPANLTSPDTICQTHVAVRGCAFDKT